jgi:uncharacterized SAM-binding protein YcdF (DUF218 family)
VKLIFTTLLLPTGLVLVGIAVALWLLWRRPRGRGAVLAVLCATFVIGYLLATPLVGRALGLMLASHIQARQLGTEDTPDAIVVLTAGIFDSGAMGWLPRAETIQRVAVAYETQRRINLRLPVIISGGHTEGVQNPSEAKVAADFFSKNRSEITPTELEETSTNTYESALQLAPALNRRGAKNVLLVTSDIHMLRALAIFRAHGIDAIPLPAMSIPHHLGVVAFLPSIRGLILSTSALYEIYDLAGSLIVGRFDFRDLTYKQPPVINLQPAQSQPKESIIDVRS